MNENWHFETICERLGEEEHLWGAVIAPLFQNSLFVHESAEAFHNRRDQGAWDYTRVGNPTIALAEKKLAALENCDRCRLFSSGMAAITAAILSSTANGKHIIATEAAYGPTKRLLTEYLSRFGIECTLVDGRHLDCIEKAIRPNTSTLYLESPGTFFFDIQDIEAICKLAHSHSITTICDNSYCTPYFQKPSRFGVDLVVHSATKYLGGHSDLLAGVVCGSAERIDNLSRSECELLGATLDPFAAWLLIRSLRTLALRMEHHQANALKVASMLHAHPLISDVFYPGLPTHPSQNLIQKQMTGSSGLMSFFPKQQDPQKIFSFIDALKLYRIGCSWGGHESLAIPLEVFRDSQPKWLIRMSIGLENSEDLIADLKEALNCLDSL
jgi:cystathionine beta-lyase/cystathionine gamma-synthase